MVRAYNLVSASGSLRGFRGGERCGGNYSAMRRADGCEQSADKSQMQPVAKEGFIALVNVSLIFLLTKLCFGLGWGA